MRSKLFVLSIAASIILGGCSTMAGNAASESIKVPAKKHLSLKKMHSLITEAGEKEGWIMTPLNSRAIVASKYEDGKSASVVINYDENSVSFEKNRSTMSDSDFSDEVEDLQEEIKEQLSE
ncbi:hypothetical protein MNB_SM-7-471 [hydrothermal vent metagenome]|uniref:Lipoprotein n=1 Tax=hydrothermal vent metagenome TaxID=652676 RepID=A0A1W1BTT9_9ZZZZ